MLKTVLATCVLTLSPLALSESQSLNFSSDVSGLGRSGDGEHSDRDRRDRDRRDRDRGRDRDRDHRDRDRGRDRDRDHRDRDRGRDAFRSGDCRLAFDDDNNNGTGSVEGRCTFKVRRGYEGEYVSIALRGRDFGEVKRYDVRVRDGRATIRFSDRNARNWKSRNVRVVARLDGDRLRVSQYLYKN